MSEIKHTVTDCKSSDLYNTVTLRDCAGIKPLNYSMPVQDYQVGSIPGFSSLFEKGG